MTTNKGAISKRTVDALKIPERGEMRLWDIHTKGFCVRAYPPSKTSPQGRKVYAVKYRVGARQRWFTIGEHGAGFLPHDAPENGAPVDLTPDRAAREAAWIIAEARRGIDPQQAKLATRRGKSVAALIEAYLGDAGRDAKPNKRERSWETDASNLRAHVVPVLGRLAAASVTEDDVARLMRKIANGETARTEKTRARGLRRVRGGEGIALRVLSTLRALYNWAIPKHLPGPNPCNAYKVAKRATVEKFLTNVEAKALLERLDELQAAGTLKPAYASIFRLLLLTGARLNEIQALRWGEVDLQRAVIVLPPDRTKAGAKTGERRIYLNTAALQILSDLLGDRAKAGFVFPASKGKSGHTVGASKVWRSTVKAGIRLHDLRHSWASMAIAGGASLPMVGGALGHSSSRATERYAHLTSDPLRELSERIAAELKR